MQEEKFPKGLIISAVLMILFGFAEVVTSFTHKFFGLTTSEVTLSTIVGAAIGIFYLLSGILVFTKRKISAVIAILFLLLAAIGRVAMVVMGLYPTNSTKQTFAIITGTSIVLFFAFYIWLQRKHFK